MRFQRLAGNRTTKRAPRPSSGGSSATLPLVALGDRLHDRQAEPRGARTVAVGAEEALEDLLLQLGRDPRPVVLDRQHDLAVAALDRGLDRGAGIGVAERVLHQVQHEPVQLVLHAVDLDAGRGRDRDLVVARDRLELRRGGRDDVAEVDRPVRDLAAGVGARQQQQVGHQPAHPAAGAQRGGGGLALLALQRLLEQLEVGQHRRQRRAQLVRGVGDELALAHERRLGLGRGPRRARAASTPASPRARRPRRRPPAAGCCAPGRACARSRARPR